MKSLKLLTLFSLGFLTIQSCSRDSAVCDCVDSFTEVMKGERENNYDGTFRDKYEKSHKTQNEKCIGYLESIIHTPEQEKLTDQMKDCSGYTEYTEELEKETAYFEK